MNTRLMLRNLNNPHLSSLSFLNLLAYCCLLPTSWLLTLAILPANAAQFQVSGQFAPQATLNKNRPKKWLENGSFKGMFEISDVPQDNNFFKVNQWNFDLLDAGGTKIFSFSSQDNSQQDYNYQLEAKRDSSGSAIRFIFDLFSQKQSAVISRRFAYFDLYLDKPYFVGKVISSSRFADVDTETNYSTFSVQQRQYEIKIISGVSQILPVQAVPENTSIAGLVSVGVLGIFLQRQQKLCKRCK